MPACSPPSWRIPTAWALKTACTSGAAPPCSPPAAEVATEGLSQDEALVVSQLDLGQVRRTRTRLPLLRDERHALTRREIARITAGDDRARDQREHGAVTR